MEEKEWLDFNGKNRPKNHKPIEIQYKDGRIDEARYKEDYNRSVIYERKEDGLFWQAGEGIIKWRYIDG